MSAKQASEGTLYTELVRRGLPADYARRTAEELDDHRADVLAELHAGGVANPELAASERLGETRLLARRIARDYRRRSWIGRWPAVAFVLAPIPVLIAAILGVNYGMTWAFSWAWPFEMPPEVWARTAPREVVLALFMVAYVIMFAVTPAAVASALSRIALASTGRRVWLVTSCLLVGVTMASFTYKVTLSYEPGGSSIYIQTPTVSANPLSVLPHYVRPVALAQFAAPMLAGFVVLLRDQRRREVALGDAESFDQPSRLAA